MEFDPNNDKLAVFHRLFRAYYAELHRYAFTILKNNQLAEDIVQNVFLTLWQKRDGIQIGEKIGNYLYTTTYHLSLNHLRNQKVKKRYVAEAMNTVKLHDNSATEKIAASDLHTRIQAVVEKLPARCRAVFLKSRVEGKRYAEIATEMNISVKTVEAQIGKALKIFREELKDYL